MLSTVTNWINWTTIEYQVWINNNRHDDVCGYPHMVRLC